MKAVLAPFIIAAGLVAIMNAAVPGRRQLAQGSTLMDAGFDFITGSPEIKAITLLLGRSAHDAARGLAALDNVTDGHPHGEK